MKKGVGAYLYLLPLLFLLGGCATLPSPQPTKSFDTQALTQKAYTLHKNLDITLQEEQKTLSDLTLAVSASQALVGGYTTFLSKSAQISSVTRFLPIPYAGEVSNATKLLSSSLLVLSIASKDIEAYTKAAREYHEEVSKASLTLNLTSLDLLQTKGTNLLNKAYEMERSMGKITHALQTLSTLTMTLEKIMETQNSLNDQAKALLGFSVPSTEKEDIAHKKMEFIQLLSTVSRYALMIEQTKKRHEKSLYYAFCLTQLAKESTTLY